MKTVGGYYLMDCSGLNLSSGSEQTITGITKRAQDALNSGKEVLACGCVEGTTKLSPIPVSVKASDSTVVITGVGIIISVAASDKATVTSSAIPLVITTQPVNASAADGAKANFTVVASGVGLTYEWWTRDTGSANFSKVSSATSATYSFTMQSSRDGREIYAVVGDIYGNTVQSNTVTATMTEQASPTVIDPVLENI